MAKVTEITESTKITLGAAGVAVAMICSIVISVTVTDAKLEAQLASQEKRLDYRREEIIEMNTKVNLIDQRTARMEGILEELRRK